MATKKYVLTWKDLTEETFDRIAKSFDATMLRKMLVDGKVGLSLELTYGDEVQKEKQATTSNGVLISDMRLDDGESWIDDTFVASTGTGKLYRTETPHTLAEEDKVIGRYFVRLRDGSIQQRFVGTGTQLAIPSNIAVADVKEKLVETEEKQEVPAPIETSDRYTRMAVTKTGMKYKRFSDNELNTMCQFVMERFIEFGGDLSGEDIQKKLDINHYRLRKLVDTAKKELAK